MSFSNKFELLSKLAGDTTNNEFSSLVEDMPDDELKSQILKLQEEERAKAVREAASVVVKLLRDTDGVIADYVNKLSLIRQKERATVSNIRKFSIVKEYCILTNDYRPLFKAIEGQCIGSVFSEITLYDSENIRKAEEIVSQKVIKKQEEKTAKKTKK